jgi:hypothetical protein
MQADVTATPSLRLIDHTSKRSMLLTGPATGDALLSAFDLLAGSGASSDLPANAVGGRVARRDKQKTLKPLI